MKVIANSSATAEATARFGFHKIEIVFLATDVEASSGVKVPGRHVLFAGRLVKRKGLAWFVREVLPKLPDDIRLKVAGTVWDER